MNQDKSHIDISIPYELAAYAIWQRDMVTSYHTNAIIKALDTWLVLKHDSVPSFIQCWRSQTDWLTRICKCNKNTLYNRLKLLERLELITFTTSERKNDSIRLCSWETLAKIFSIDITNKLTLQYKINDDQKIFQWIIAAEIENNQNRQDIAIIKKLNKNPECYNAVLMAMLRDGADRNKLQSPSYFLSRMKLLYLADFVQVSEIHDILIAIRPEHDRGVITMAEHWNAQHPMTVTYWKNKLFKAKIVDIDKIQVRSHERARNKHCTVLWLNAIKQTLLCLPDRINVLKPWLCIQPIQPL